MQRLKWIALAVGLSITTTSCATALGNLRLEGLQALGGRSDSSALAPIESHLSELADAVEAEAPLLDVAQVTIDPANNLVVIAVLSIPQTGTTEDQAQVFKRSIEAIWLAALEFTPEVNQIAVGLMQIVPVHTLDRGTAPGGWLVGAITLSMEDAVRYLGQSDGVEARAALWESEVLRITPLSEAYTGRPNHPLRSLEASS